MNKAEFSEEIKHTFETNSLSEYATDEYIERFYQLTQFMLEANQKMNLTALRDEKSVITRHIADCLLAASLLPQNGALLDVGSGGGMPALPFAIVRPDLTVTALDATAKKTAYIAAAAESLGLRNVRILTGRAEELGADRRFREKFDIVCARAVADLRVLLEWCVPFAKAGGIFLALKGKNAQNELDFAQNAIKTLSCALIKDEKLILTEDSEETSERHNLLFRKNTPTDKRYPRRNAVIQKSPL